MKTKISLALGLATVLGAQDNHYTPQVKVRTLLKSDTTSNGTRVVYPTVAHPEVTSIAVDIPPGAQTGWHSHPVPGYAFVLAGTLDVEEKGGKTRRFGPGMAFAEMVGKSHNGRTVGQDTVKLLVTFTGEKGKGFTAKDDDHPGVK